MYLDHILKKVDKGLEIHSKSLPQIDLLDITSIVLDSRKATPGSLFGALAGIKEDGEKYIGNAIEKGASVVLASKATCESLTHQYPQVIFLSHANVQEAFYQILRTFYTRRPKIIVAVTGTNGKTSTVEFARQIWKLLGYSSATLGSFGLVSENRCIKFNEFKVATPDAATLAQLLTDLESDGVSHLAMEATSHGLHQGRLKNMRFQAAGFTNLTRDHLDYHANMSEYLEAKLILFKELMAPGGTIVLNADIEIFNIIKNASYPHPLITYGKAGGDISINYIQPLPHGQKLSINIFGKRYHLEIPLVGRFQVMNALCALGLVLATDPERSHEAILALEKLEGVRGRLELVGHSRKGAAVYIDYAHSPDALKSALSALKPHTENNLYAIFGCGGNRDKGKRPQMGKIAAELANYVIVTDDNPRYEDAAVIRSEVIAGCPNAKNIGDRREAIQEALNISQAGDVILIAGKGHESGQIIGDKVTPFDDREVVRELLRR